MKNWLPVRTKEFQTWLKKRSLFSPLLMMEWVTDRHMSIVLLVGGQGITGIDSRGKGQRPSIVAAFTVREGDQLVMVSDAWQIIRCPLIK